MKLYTVFLNSFLQIFLAQRFQCSLKGWSLRMWENDTCIDYCVVYQLKCVIQHTRKLERKKTSNVIRLAVYV
jgi:hypothetical protein